MPGYIRPNGSYYEGDQADASHQAVPERPSAAHEWIGGEWHVNSDQADAAADAARRADYASEADPLFFKAQRGEINEQVWRDKIAEIRARHPKSTD